MFLKKTGTDPDEPGEVTPESVMRNGHAETAGPGARLWEHTGLELDLTLYLCFMDSALGHEPLTLRGEKMGSAWTQTSL